jgi:pimeloyl-ACP methyl ester carboxylesterase
MRILRLLLSTALVAWLVVFLAYRLMDPEWRTMNDEARAGVAGRFVRLADGVTHYESAGPDTGRVVVLAAAFSVPAYLSDSLFQRLGRAGFRVIRFDYYGRGWSDRPNVAYGLDLYDRQLADLLDSLGVQGPVDLAGLSFGAAIVTDFTDRYPDRVRSLIYIDPVFNTGRQLSPEERTAFAWDLHMVFGGGTDAMADGQMDDLFRPERHPDWVARYRVGQQFKGTREALRRTRVAIAAAPDQSAQIRQVGASPRPVLVVWGREDQGAPFAESAALLDGMPQATLVPVDSAGHLPHLDQPDVVVPAVVAFLTAHPS